MKPIISVNLSLEITKLNSGLPNIPNFSLFFIMIFMFAEQL